MAWLGQDCNPPSCELYPNGVAMSEKSRENQVRRAAKRQGLRLVKSRRRDRWADDYGLHVLVDDCRGNRHPGAQAPLSAVARGEGMSVTEAAETLLIPDTPILAHWSQAWVVGWLGRSRGRCIS
jgi:hypothetical protein